MRNYLIFLTVILFILFIVFSLIKNNNIDDHGFTESENVPGFEIKSFEDQVAGYKIKYPASWSLEDHTFKDELIRADLYYSEEAGLQIRLENNENFSENEFAEAYLKRYIRDMRSHWQGKVRIESSEQKLLGCCNAYVYHIIHERNSKEKWLLINYLWFKEDRVVIFQGGMLRDKENELRTNFDVIVNSFLFIQ